MHTHGLLRTCQILLFMLSCTCAVVVSVAMGWTTRILKDDCVLYSKPSFITLANGSLLLHGAVWGRPSDCNFCTFCPVGVIIYCIVWIWFYVFLSDWGTFFTMNKSEWDSYQQRYLPEDQHLLIPSLVSNILIFALLLANVVVVVSGSSEFCENVERSLNRDSPSPRKECDYVGSVAWTNVEDGGDIYSYLHRAKGSAWVLLASVAVQTALIFVRLKRNSRDVPESINVSSIAERSSVSSLRVRYRKRRSSTRLQSEDDVSIETNSSEHDTWESERLLRADTTLPNGTT